MQTQNAAQNLDLLLPTDITNVTLDTLSQFFFQTKKPKVRRFFSDVDVTEKRLGET